MNFLFHSVSLKYGNLVLGEKNELKLNDMRKINLKKIFYVVNILKSIIQVTEIIKV